MFGGVFGTVLRSFGAGLTLGGMLVAAAPGVGFGVAVAYIGFSVFVAALIWPVVENVIARIYKAIEGMFCDVLAKKSFPWSPRFEIEKTKLG